jgi:uncharacterized protein YecT (DUF1311 family)
MKIDLKSVAFLVLLFLCAVANAQYRCDYNGSQREMNACAIRDYKQSDATLNMTYQKVKAKLNEREQGQLQREQRSWMKRRDARCASKKNGPGTNVTIDYLTCLQTYTELRTLELRTR